jgi:hypothetical protein
MARLRRYGAEGLGASVWQLLWSLLKYPCTPRESALGRMARRERRAYPQARPCTDHHDSPPPPRWSVRSEQRWQTPQSALGSPNRQPPLFPSATSARRVAPLFGLAGVARWLQTAEVAEGNRGCRRVGEQAGMLPPRVLARPKIGVTRGAWVFQQTPRSRPPPHVRSHQQHLPRFSTATG